MQIASVDIYSVRGQVIVMLLEILRVDGANTRRGATGAIADWNWFEFQSEDLQPYPQQTNREPRWRTLIAWARQDAMDYEFLSDVGHDTWQLSAAGQREADSVKQKFEVGELDVRRCYMWRARFKKFMCSSHEPSLEDSERPPHIYEDQVPYDAAQQALWLLHDLQRRIRRQNA